MSGLRLLKAFNDIDGVLVERAAPGKNKRPRWVRALATAACLALVIGSAGTVIDRLGLFRAGCSAWPGDFIDGRYYFRGGYGALYCWDGQTTEKVLGALASDGKLVNEYGVYFTRGRRLYVKPHDTGQTEKLYTASLSDRSHIGFDLYGEDVVVRIYNKRKEHASEVLVDGLTGQVLATVTDHIPYSELYDNLAWGDTHVKVGERELVMVPLEDENRFDLTEQGASILPEGASAVYAYYYRKYDQVWFDLVMEDGKAAWLAVRSDYGDRMIAEDGNWSAAGDFAYRVGDSDGDTLDDAVWCLDTRTGEQWRLETDTQMEFYEITTDGVHLASCVPWDDYQAMWRIEYDDRGCPASLVLLDENVGE